MDEHFDFFADTAANKLSRCGCGRNPRFYLRKDFYAYKTQQSSPVSTKHLDDKCSKSDVLDASNNLWSAAECSHVFQLCKRVEQRHREKRHLVLAVWVY